MLVKMWCENTKEGMEYLSFNGYNPVCKIGKKFWIVKRIGNPLDDVRIIRYKTKFKGGKSPLDDVVARCSEDWKSDPFNLERYFSEWFDIISYDDAKNRWENGERNFLVLLNDGSDRYANCFATWEELEETYPDAYFGIEK